VGRDLLDRRRPGAGGGYLARRHHGILVTEAVTELKHRGGQLVYSSCR